MKNVKGITLVALVITIVVLLILSAVTISLTLGERGVFNLAQKSGSESNKAEATEKVNLKITQAQMKSYIEKQRLPNLQELADEFCEDGDFAYVATSKKEVARRLDPINVGISDSIFVKLEDYTYEFEIDSRLRLASIDGVRLATVPENDEDTIVSMTKGELQTLIANEVRAQISSNTPTNPIPSGISNYSTEPQVIGTWTNGKPIYRIVIYNTTLTSIAGGNWVKYCSSASLNIEDIVDATFGRLNNGNRYEVSHDVYVNNSEGYIQLLKPSASLNMGGGSCLVLEYTKTTDSVPEG